MSKLIDKPYLEHDMSFKTVQTTTSAALAAAGTVTISYPDGTNAGTFSGAVGHKLATGSGDVYTSPANFTLSFGASDITLTSVDMALAAETKLYVELQMRGEDDGDPSPLVSDNIFPTSTVVLSLGAPDTADANGYVESQDLTSAGVFSVDTTAAAAIAAAALAGEADVPRNVVAAWTTTAVLTVTGKDKYGNTMVESSASGTSMTGKKAFAEVTDVSTSANITGLTVGTGDVLGLPVFVGRKANVIAELKDGVALPRNGDKVYLTARILDAGTASSVWIPCPVAGSVAKVSTILHGAISGADEVVTMEVNGTAVDGLSITIANASSAAGDVDSDTPTAGHASTVVAVGDKLEIINSGASTGTALVTVVIEIDTTYTLNGTLVVGSDSAPTATTGDVRGTYDPTDACNGAKVFELVAVLEDPAYKGLTQYAG